MKIPLSHRKSHSGEVREQEFFAFSWRDMDLEVDEILFVDEYLKNGFKAGKAYKTLHPDVTVASSYELGSKLLRKIEKSAYFQSRVEELHMGREEYLKILTAKARKGHVASLQLLGRLHLPTKIEGTIEHTVSWREFVNSDTPPTNE